MLKGIKEAPCELQCGIYEFFPESEWDNAADIAWIESAWNAFAIDDTRDSEHPCGSVIRTTGGMAISAEFSIGYFQINACNFPDWPFERFFNARHNIGTAHSLWDSAGQSWQPWYFSAKQLGLI